MRMMKKGAQYLQMEQVNQQIRHFLSRKPLPSEAEVTDFLNNLQPTSVKPTCSFHRINPKSLNQPTVVAARLMVQDVRDVYFYVSFAIKRNYDESSPFCTYKYGNTPHDEPKEVQDQTKYIHVMTDRSTVICTPVRYQTAWADQLQGRINQINIIELEVDGRADYRLGEMINVVALYDPHMQKLFMIRPMTAEEVEQGDMDLVGLLASKEVDLKQGRQDFMSFMCNYASQSFSEYLLLTLLSEESLFLGCDANIAPLITEIFPRVAHIKLVHPCNKSLFPYKNEEGELQLAEMQMSNLRTFVVLDISEFSKQEKVVIKGTEFQNFNALKLFVEEGKTIYRWEIGEGQVEHKHIGVVVKASQLITPTFNPKLQNISPDLTTNNIFTEQTKNSIRAYLQRAMALNPKLDDEQRKLIEKELGKEQEKEKVAVNLANIMKLSRLLARSHGRNEIIFEDFRRSRELIDTNQLNK